MLEGRQGDGEPLGAEGTTQAQRRSIRVKVEFHVRNGWGGDGRTAVPGGEEIQPPPDVCASVGREVDMMMKVSGGRRKVN